MNNRLNFINIVTESFTLNKLEALLKIVQSFNKLCLFMNGYLSLNPGKGLYSQNILRQPYNHSWGRGALATTVSSKMPWSLQG
jgi:hypothetical protein